MVAGRWSPLGLAHRFRSGSGRDPEGPRSPQCGILPPSTVDLSTDGERLVGGRHVRGHRVSQQSELRPEVVDAIVGVLKGGDPADLPSGATKEEKDAAKDRYLSEFIAERKLRDRQSQAWDLLLTRSYDDPPTWRQIFDDLAPESVDELGTLYDALPAGAQEEYVRRFGVPSGV